MMQHEQTRIYQRALELVRLAREVENALPNGCGFLADQLRRAASSVVLTFAEGYDKGSLAEQRRFFRMAQASSREVAAVLDVAQCLGVIHLELHTRGKDIADHLERMLRRFRRGTPMSRST
jgi:four helix bundle protein